MKLRKTKSAVAILLAVMLLVSTMIVAPVTASAAKVESGSVGENYPITESQINKVHFGFGGDNGSTTEWNDVSVSYDQATGYFLSEEITVPSDVEGLTHIYYGFIAYSHWGDTRYYKGNSSVADARPKLGEFNKDHWAFWDSEYNTDPNNKGDRDLLSTVVPGMKIRFRFWRFEMDCVQLVYAVFATYDPEEEAASLGTVSIEVEPEHADYTTDRAVTVTVSDIDTHIPAGDVVIPTPTFGKGVFTPNAAGTYETTDGNGNRIVKLEGTLSNFADTDVSANPYTATATATTAQDSYFDNATQTRYFFTANSATDTYYIEDIPVVEPTEENQYITVTLSVSPDTIEESQATTLTATVTYPSKLPADQVQYVGVTVSDVATGDHFLTPSNTTDDAANRQKVFTFNLAGGTYSADNSPIRFTANPTYTGSDYLDTAQNILYHFIPFDRAYADLTVNPSFETVTEYVEIALSVDPTSMVYDGSAVVTADMTAPAHFPASDITSIGANLSENTGKTVPGASSVSHTQTTVTEVYTLPAGFFTASDIGTVTFTAAANIDPAVADVVDTANRKIYHFEVGQPATATLELTGKNNEIPVINNVEGGGIQLEVTPEVDLYNIQRDAVVTVSNIDPHIYAEFGNYDHIALALTDDKGHTFDEDTTKRNSVTATSFKTAFVVPDNTYSIADVGIVTYTVTATYDGGDIYDATNATTYSFTDGQTATDTSDLTDYDENLQYSGRYLILLDAIEVVYVVPAASISDYTDPVLSVTNLYENNSITKNYVGELNTASGNYEFKFKVAPGYVVDDMGLTMRATRISDNKTVTGLQRVDSIYTYAYTALDIYQNYTSLPGYPELLSTMVDMLNYAAAVQQLGGHHKEKLANDNIAQYQKFSLTENFTPEDKNGNMNVLTTGAIFAIGGTGLKFDANITPRFQVNPAAGQDASTLRWSEDYYLEVKVGSKSYHLTTPVETSIYQGSYLYSMFEFNDLMANQLNREIFVTVRETATGVAVSDTYRYTANSYLPRYLAYCDQYNYTPDAKIVAVTAAMARYGESTRQYALLQGHVL